MSFGGSPFIWKSPNRMFNLFGTKVPWCSGQTNALPGRLVRACGYGKEWSDISTHPHSRSINMEVPVADSGDSIGVYQPTVPSDGISVPYQYGEHPQAQCG